MGIHGFTKYLGLIGSSVEHVPSRTKLLIDGNGWMFHILKSNANILGREFGGSYRIFDSKVREELAILTEEYHFDLVFYFDGSISRMKEKTALKRKEDDAKAWSNLLSYCQEGMNCDQDDFPTPLLYSAQLLATLKQLSYKVLHCSEEADQEIAKACVSSNISSETSHFCYAMDSDFLLFKSTPYIPFGGFTPPLNQYTGGAMAKVYRRQLIAESLGLSEQQLIEFAILIGNDFTGLFPRALFFELNKDNTSISLDEDSSSNESTEEPSKPYPRTEGHSAADIEALLVWLTAQGVDFKLKSDDAELLQAINYSRALYNLDDLTPFPVDVKVTRLMSLSTFQKHSIKSFVISHRDLCPHDKNTAEADAATLHKTAMEYLESVTHDQFEAVDESEGNDEDLVEYGIEPEDLEDIRAMCDTIASINRTAGPIGNDTSFTPISDDDALHEILQLAPPEWSDVIVALQYQLICREIAKCLLELSSQYSDESKADNVPVIFSAKDIFDGPIFHSLRHARKREARSAELPDLTTLELEDGEVHEYGRTDEPIEAPRKTYPDQLPIDAFRDEILARVQRDRVTVIHGETGCGKSSRVPAILLEDALKRNTPCRMMVSQPRRIAASSLMKRLRTTLGNKVGLRMGHGVRDEDEHTRIFFVTTGYLVRLIAHHATALADHTHLIIDEVHERSVDGDLLCLLARRLLQANPSIRLILMSATIHTDLYREYFSNQREYYGPLDCLSVGARRFPVDILHAEDILAGRASIDGPVMVVAKRLVAQTQQANASGHGDVPIKLSADQYIVAVALVKKVVQRGTGVLIFVSGMLDISELMDQFEGLPGFKLFAIHSDIPFEDQEAAFSPVQPDQIKVVIATNAAESSITLPDVDVVICFGTHKAMQYNNQTHCVQLVNTWISKASATQRAGRTGRVRPGTVYRLYSRRLSEDFDDHEQAEVHRQPLQNVILRLRAMLEDAEAFEGVVPVLMDLLEPPSMGNVDKSFDFLYDIDMITSPSDAGELTSLGKFAGILPVDLRHTRLIAYGTALGLTNEAVIIAAALSLPRAPFFACNPLIFTDPDQYNHKSCKIFLGNILLDAGMYSQPIMMLCLLIRWRELKSDDAKYKWAQKYGISFKTMKQFEATARHLSDTVNSAVVRSGGEYSPKYGNFNGRKEVHQRRNSTEFHDIKYPTKETLNMLRLLLVWTADGGIFRCVPGRAKRNSDRNSLEIVSPQLSIEHIKPLFPKEVAWEVKNRGSRMYTAPLSTVQREKSSGEVYLAFCTLGESVGVSVLWIHVQSLAISDTKDIGGGSTTMKPHTIIGIHENFSGEFLVKLKSLIGSGKLEGVGRLAEGSSYVTYMVDNPTRKQMRVVDGLSSSLPSCLRMNIPADSTAPAVLMAYNCVPSGDATELLFFGCNANKCMNSEHDHKHDISLQLHDSSQQIVFPDVPEPFKLLPPIEDPYAGGLRDISACEPLIDDLPVGIRLLNNYQLGYYKDRCLKLWRNPSSENQRNLAITETKSGRTPKKATIVPGTAEWKAMKEATGGEGLVDAEDDKIQVTMKIMSSGWEYVRGIGAGEGKVELLKAYMPSPSVMSVAVPAGTEALYGVSQSVIILGAKGSSIRCQWTTFLPPGALWVTLALECAGMSTPELHKKEPRAHEVPTDMQLYQAGHIAMLLSAFKDKPMEFSPRLHELITNLFRRWITGDASDEEEEVNEWQYERLRQHAATMSARSPTAPKRALGDEIGGYREDGRDKSVSRVVVADTAGQISGGKSKDKKKASNKKAKARVSYHDIEREEGECSESSGDGLDYSDSMILTEEERLTGTGTGDTFTCPHCSTLCKNASRLQRHLRRSHTISPATGPTSRVVPASPAPVAGKNAKRGGTKLGWGEFSAPAVEDSPSNAQNVSHAMSGGSTQSKGNQGKKSKSKSGASPSVVDSNGRHLHNPSSSSHSPPDVVVMKSFDQSATNNLKSILSIAATANYPVNDVFSAIEKVAVAAKAVSAVPHFQCGVCSKLFKKRAGLVMHMSDKQHGDPECRIVPVMLRVGA